MLRTMLRVWCTRLANEVGLRSPELTQGTLIVKGGR